MTAQARGIRGRRRGVIVAIALAVALVAAVCCWAADMAIEIEVAPKVLNLGSQGQVVTVHTNVAFTAVDGWSVSLNEIPIQSFKSDNRGYFVAKFDIEEVKGLVDNGDLAVGVNVLTLEGYTKTDDFFTGTTTFTVVDNDKAPKK